VVHTWSSEWLSAGVHVAWQTPTAVGVPKTGLPCRV